MDNIKHIPRIGILGGSFNPIHYAHIYIARNAYMAAELSCVYFMPTFVAPHKTSTTMAPYTTRCSAVEKAIQNEQGMKISYIESTLPVPSYTYQTKKALEEYFPRFELFFIFGSSDFLTIDTWHEGEMLLRTMNTIILPRYDVGKELIEQYIGRYTPYSTIQTTATTTQYKTTTNTHIFIDIPTLPLSSTQVRNVR